MMCSRSFQNVLFACALAGLAVWSAAPAGAEIIPVNLQLDPPAGAVNTLDVSITVNVGGGSIADGDTTTASGNMLANLHATFDPVHVTTVTGLEFTGGTMAFTDMSFPLNSGALGSIAAASQGMQATTDTPVPPGSVTGTTFPGLEHEVIFNAGTVDMTPSGIIAGVLGPITYDFSTGPLAVTDNAPGTLTVSAPTIIALNATYDVFLSVPVDFNEVMFQDPNASAELSAIGTIQASGQFTRVIPEPSSALVLVLGICALRRRRHGE